MKPRDVANLAQALCTQLDRVVVGKADSTQACVSTLLCEGHILIEDVPGVGKTTLAKAIARCIGGTFTRVQFTPDLLPGDVTGTSVYDPKESRFEFVSGPVFTNVLLADEINRATPKTQSALLEAMEERQVSADGVRRPLPEPFVVIATQNTVEMAGTYPLPEAQMDRFFSLITLGYPDREAEAQMLSAQRVERPLDRLEPVVSLSELLAAQRAVREIAVDGTVQTYIVDLVRATRESPRIALGASPRASLHLQHAAQGRAATEGREFVTPDDVKFMAPMVLGHRLIPRGEARARGAAVREIVSAVLETVPTPVPVR